MTKVEPRGCLSVLLGLLGIRLGGPSAGADQLPYRLREDFLSSAEASFYRVLQSSLNDTFLVCPKVNLADIFFVPRSEGSQSYKNKIDRKHVDFLLCDPATLTPVLGIELDDASHARSDRQTRDQFVNEVFKAAGVPLLRVPAAKGYSPPQLADLVQQTIAGHVKPVKSVKQDGEVPICKKCEEPMVQRAATKGDQKGKEFWGCRNYPKCRETVPV